MADIQDTDLFLVNRNNSTASLPASELMAEILDDDLMLVNRGGKTYKVTGLEVKDSLGPTDEPPSMTGATLAGTGASFSGQTYTTTLQNYNPGVPEADQTMLAKVTGALSVVGETSAITDVGQPFTSTMSGSSYVRAVDNGTNLFQHSNPTQAQFFELAATTMWSPLNPNPDRSSTNISEVYLNQADVNTVSFTFEGTAPIKVLASSGASGGTGYSLQFEGTGFTEFSFNGSAPRYDTTMDEITITPTADSGTISITCGTTAFIKYFPMSQGSVLLTLTDRKDLDNGLFQRGDEVQSSGSTPAVKKLMGNHSPGNNINTAPTFSSYFDKGDTTTLWSSWNVTFKILPSLAPYSSGIGLWYSSDGVNWTRDSSTNVDNPQNHPAGNNHALDRYFAIATYAATDAPAGSAPSCYMEVNSGPTAYSIVGSGYTGLPTLVSIDPVDPKMTVSGGSWTQGETVKNTVARAPVITPTTDGIVGVATGTGPSTPYSDDLSMSSGSFEAGYPATQAFDGDTSTYARSGTKGAIIRFQPNGGMAYTSKVEAYFFASGGNVNVQMNSGGYSGNYAPGQWHEIATGSGNIGILYLQPTAGSAYIGLAGLKVDGVLLMDTPPTILTLATDKDLAQFSANDDVKQNSGYQPITSAISNVATDSVSKVKAYYSNTAPANLAEAITGTEYDLTKANTNTVDNGHFLTLVCEDGCPTSGQVFKTDSGPIFNMKYNTGSGNFDKDGNKLGAADQPPSGPSDTTQIVFNDGETTGFIVNIQAAYTVISTMNLGTVPVVVDAAQGEESVLTLTDDKDLANFRVGDKLGGFSDDEAVGSNPSGTLEVYNRADWNNSYPVLLSNFVEKGGILVAPQSASGNYGNQQYELTLNDALDTTGDAEYFAECWFYKETAAGNYAFNGNVSPFNFYGNNNIATTVLGGYISSTSHYLMYKGTGPTLHSRPAVNTGTAFSDIGVGWHHIAWYIDDQGTNVYCNGVRVGGENLAGTATPDPTTRATTGWSNTYQSNDGYCPNMPIAFVRFCQGNPYGTAASDNFTPLPLDSTEWEASDKVKLFIPLTTGDGSTVLDIKKDSAPYQMTVSAPKYSQGQTVVGPEFEPATGTVASTDPVAKTMTLATSDESNGKRWIVNAGKTVVGPTGPATRFDAYLTWSGKQVTGLSTTDPGYAQAPPDLQLQFTDPAPSGQTWDQELPAGTTIQTRVKATNASGDANSGWSNVVTPRFLRPGDALPETFAETSLRMATFENRAAVHQGELAMEKREELAKALEAKGINASELLGVKAKAKRGRKKAD